MNKLFTIALFLTLINFSIIAQYDGPTAPDYKEIEKNIAIRYQYSDLMEQYLAGNNDMTIDEQRHLYYGYVFQIQYNPSDTSRYNNELAISLSKVHLSDNDYNIIEKSAKALIAEDPFNLRALNALLIVYAEKDNVEQYKITNQKIDIVQRAIASSGDGMTTKTAYYVIKVSHEYDILNFLGYRYGGSKKLEKDKCNSLTLAPNPYDIDKVYFNIEPSLNYAKRKGGTKFKL